MVKFKTWEQITHEVKIDNNFYFKWIQLVWIQNLYYLNHHFIKSNQLHSVGKLTTKKLYLIRLQHETATPASQK